MKIKETGAHPKTHYRVAAYCLVKAEDKKENPMAQTNYYSRMAAAEPTWELVNIYEDAATRTGHRPQFMQMMADAKDGMFDIILVKSVSRFAGKAADCQKYIRELKKCGVEVRFECECISSMDPSTEVILSLLAAAQYEKPAEITV